MKVAEAIMNAIFLDGSHVLEFVASAPRPNREVAAYDITHVAAVSDDRPFLLFRRRGAYRSRMRRMGEPYTDLGETTLEDPMPAWEITRGHVTNHQGHYGLWLPHLPDLLAECVLVPIAVENRPRSRVYNVP